MTFRTLVTPHPEVGASYPLLRVLKSSLDRKDKAPVVVLFTKEENGNHFGVPLSGLMNLGELSDGFLSPHSDNWLPCTITLTSTD